ncbi:BRO family protein [Roseomonas sp. CAU 1739]|uniref:BRO family protein n=1 Tax=Roseomonas sp. CAU 1739 TaxID=3140364 RepID=UPI0038D0896D
MPFVFEGAEVRVVVRGGAPWFVASDVCKALGLTGMPGSTCAAWTVTKRPRFPPP